MFQRNLSNFRGLVLFCIEADFCNHCPNTHFFSILRDLQDLHTFAPLESQVENYLEKNLPENPKENERTRPHGKVEKVETTREAWNSAETMRRTTAERRAAAENIFMHFHVFSCIFTQEHAISEDAFLCTALNSNLQSFAPLIFAIFS